MRGWQVQPRKMAKYEQHWREKKAKLSIVGL
jgi:hypothetical protein